MPATLLRPLPWTEAPASIAARWPRDRPLVLLHSGGAHERWARWSLLAEPGAVWRFRDGRSRLEGPAPRPRRWRHDPLADLDALLDASRRAPATGLPFAGGWIGVLSYDLGRRLEPTAVHVPPALDDRGWSDAELLWCPGAFVFDHAARRWHAVGDADPAVLVTHADSSAPGRAGPLVPRPDRDGHVRAIRIASERIAAGDIFQVNLARRLTAPWRGSTRDFARRALPGSGAWYGASLELPGGRAVVSFSPELFLERDGDDVVTRPIKGTCPAGADPAVLLDSAKDAAELHMIVDLMRNDLGRVCRYGSIHVPAPRCIEPHAGVLHGVGEIRGRLRPGTTCGTLVRAAFPPGSVTGAPKIRAMQIIDELEPVRRGPYCGSIACFSACGRATLNVAIRTLAFTGRRRRGRWDALAGRLDYGTGGGIVADSDPAAEWAETEAKTTVLRAALATAEKGPRVQGAEGSRGRR